MADKSAYHTVFRALRRGACAVVVLAAVAAGGCGPFGKKTASTAPTYVAGDPTGRPLTKAEIESRDRAIAAHAAKIEAERQQKEAAFEAARAEYNANRPVPPDKYTVPPKPPRNNTFGEFEDELHHGIDSQPALPALPADSAMSVPPVRFRDSDSSAYSQGYGQGRVEKPAFGASGAQSAGGGRVSGGSAPQNASEGLYAIEQLVYGGDHAEMDSPDAYRLQPRDVVTVTVRDHEEFSGQLEIQADGTVRVPNAPDLVRLRGLTCDEAANALRNAIAPYVRGETRVRVQANRARGGYYHVFGDVLQPGRFPMGMETVKLSDAILAANWEANPARRDMDGEELGPAFPAASPRGKFIAPQSADLARVMLVTPHRSQPVRTVHDTRSALMGLTGDDPVVRPGQVIIVPSLDPSRNLQLGLRGGLAVPDGRLPGRGFSMGGATARLPEVTPPARAPGAVPRETITVRETNMMGAFDANLNTSGAVHVPDVEEYCPPVAEVPPARSSWKMGF